MEGLHDFGGDRECGHSQGLPEIFGDPYLSHERVKLRTSYLAGTFNKSPLKISEKRERGRIQGLPILGTPII